MKTHAEMRRLQNNPTILRANCHCCCHGGEPCPSDGLPAHHPCCAESVTILVNGSPYVWEKPRINFFDMVRLSLTNEKSVSFSEAERMRVMYRTKPNEKDTEMSSCNAVYNPSEGMIITVVKP